MEGFVRPTGPCPARVMIVGEAPGESEIARGMPLVGYAGQELDRMLQEAGFMRSQCFITLVSRVRPTNNDSSLFFAMRKKEITPAHVIVRDKHVLPPIRDGIELLKREIEMCRPNVIIAIGNVAMWALTGQWGVDSWRGSQLECDLPLALDYRPKVIPTYAPGRVFAQWHIRPIVVHDLRKAAKEAATREYARPDYQWVTRPDFNTAWDILNQLNAQLRATSVKLKLSVDIETRAGHIACIGIAWSKTEAICIPLMCIERDDGYWTEEEEYQLMMLMHDVLVHPMVEVVGQNFLYDAQYFHRHLLYIPRLVRDTMITQHVCFGTMPKGLDFLSSMYCDYHVYWKDDGKDWGKDQDEDKLWRYNCEDACRTYEVDEVEQQTVDKLGLRSVHDFQQRLFWNVLDAMILGFRVDHQRRNNFSTELISAIEDRENQIEYLLGHPLNPKSALQMQKLFYADLSQRPILNRKTGNPSCDDEALRKISDREPLLAHLCRLILDHRSLSVFLSTFVSAGVDVDGRMRSSFNIAGTETYRFSSSQNAFGSGLNMQNIPKGDESEGAALALPNVRKLFIPDPGMELFDIDLSSADLRIVVWEADEPEMKAMLREGLDPYTEIAKEFYKDATITKKDPRRQTFKSFAHGTHYLGTAKGLAERLGLAVHQAESTQKWYFGKFPRIKQWQDDLKVQVEKRRMVQNAFGYRRYFFERIEGTIFNEAAAWIPQSTVACLINRAWVKIRETLPDVQILLQVHDSLVGQYPIHCSAELQSAIVAASEISIPYADPLIIPVGIKTSQRSWGDCEG